MRTVQGGVGPSGAASGLKLLDSALRTTELFTLLPEVGGDKELKQIRSDQKAPSDPQANSIQALMDTECHSGQS